MLADPSLVSVTDAFPQRGSPVSFVHDSAILRKPIQKAQAADAVGIPTESGFVSRISREPA
jgi:hypothetical protein